MMYICVHRKKIIWNGINQGVYCDYLLEARAWVTKDNIYSLSVCYHFPMMNIYCLYHKNIISKHVLSFAAVCGTRLQAALLPGKLGIMKVRASEMAQEFKPLSHKPDDQNLCKNSQM